MKEKKKEKEKEGEGEKGGREGGKGLGQGRLSAKIPCSLRLDSPRTGRRWWVVAEVSAPLSPTEL